MAMEIINKKHRSITQNLRINLMSYVRISEDAKHIYFSAGAFKEFGIAAGLRVNFINDGDDWLFFFDSSEDGFLLSKNSGKHSSKICDASLVSLFMKRTKCSSGSKFPIIMSNAELDGHKLFKIEINKPLQ